MGDSMKLKPAVYAGIIAAAALSRLIPHAPNFTPIGTLALFAGASFEEGIAAYAVPIAAMLLSDALLGYGFHHAMPTVYASFLLTVFLGRALRGRNRNAASVAAASLASSTLFYALTNLSVWMYSSMYPHTITGLTACYIAAIPFFGNTLASGVFYSALMFGSAALADRTVLKAATA